MNKRSAFLSYIKIIVLVLLLVFMTMSITPASAIDTTEEGTRRADMMAIAQRYVSYKWTALNSTWEAAPPNTNEKHSSHVDTPDVIHCASQIGSTWGCWDKAPAENTGVPYFWGGSTAVEDDPNDDIPDLHLKPHDIFYPAGGLPPVGYFGEKIAAGAPAGDVGTNDDVAWSFANGVDCIGFVGQVWRTGTRLNMPKALQMMRPIRFEDLRPGDVIQRYISGSTLNHVVLFSNWVDYNPAVHGPPVNGTRFQVYEAALKPNKVVVSTYELVSIDYANPETRYFRGRGYATDKVTIRRINYCTGGDCQEDNQYEDANYYPYTYLNPIDVVLVIDQSGSMSGNKIGMAKNAAKMFVDLMRPGDKISIVAFNDTASVKYSLQEIMSPGSENYVDVKNQAKIAIDTISATGGTSIGAGLLKGREQLNTYGPTDPIRLMVLLSDGAGSGVDQALPSIIADKIVVHALGIGNADHTTLDKIATQTGGTYYYYNTTHGITDIFLNTYSTIYGENVVRRISGVVPQNSTVEQTVPVDSTIGAITFTLNWPGSDLDLTLVRPDGTIVNPSVADTDPEITFASGSTYEFYTVSAPQPGVWTMRIFGKLTDATGEDYTVSASAMDAMMVSAEVEGETHVTGNPVKISAFIKDSSLVDPLEIDYVHGVTMNVQVEYPFGISSPNGSFQLYDDGLHGDGAADDGVYANTFSDTWLQGNYSFNIEISGTNNIYGQSFTRQHRVNTNVNIVGNRLVIGPAVWDFEYPTTSQFTFHVTYPQPGTINFESVHFEASDMEQVGNPANKIPASAFTFVPNDFPMSVGSSQDVVVTATLPPGTPAGEYEGNFYVTYDRPGGSTVVALGYVYITNLGVANNPPQFELGSDATQNEGVQFARSVAFTDPDSNQWQLAIDYGDGSPPVNNTLNAQGNVNLNHPYADEGVYTLSVSLSDNAGATTSDTMTVTTANVAPTVNAGDDQIGETNSSFSINGFYLDAGIADIHTATINWGDGNAEAVPTSVTGPGTGQVTGQHTFVSAGNYTVDVCVTDNDGGTGCDTLDIEVISTSTPTNTPTSTPTFTPTPTATPTPTLSNDLIFADGFESGDFSAWTSSSTDGGDLGVSTTAALTGNQGMQALIDDANAIYVTDDNPNTEPRYRARFYFDPNSLTMADGDAHIIFSGYSGTSTAVLRVEFRFSSGAYQIRASMVNDGSTWKNTSWFTISDASHAIELDWRAATSASVHDGGLTLWIDGTQQAALTSWDNDTRRIDHVWLGALADLDAGTGGTYYLDAFESRRSSYIGP